MGSDGKDTAVAIEAEPMGVSATSEPNVIQTTAALKSNEAASKGISIDALSKWTAVVLVFVYARGFSLPL